MVQARPDRLQVYNQICLLRCVAKQSGFLLEKNSISNAIFFSFTMNGEHKSEFFMKAIKCFHSISLGVEIVGDFLKDFLSSRFSVIIMLLLCN